jgi:hypothetical protein
VLLFEPIVLFLSLLSGFSDALIFSFLESYGIVFGQWDFNALQFSLAMFALLIGYCVAYFSFFPVIRHHNKMRKIGDATLTPESRLWWLLYLAPLLPIGLLGSAFVVTGPPLPWYVSSRHRPGRIVLIYPKDCSARLRRADRDRKHGDLLCDHRLHGSCIRRKIRCLGHGRKRLVSVHMD